MRRIKGEHVFDGQTKSNAECLFEFNDLRAWYSGCPHFFFSFYLRNHIYTGGTTGTLTSVIFYLFIEMA